MQILFISNKRSFTKYLTTTFFLKSSNMKPNTAAKKHQSSEIEEELPKKKLAMSKTPITILEETCAKQVTSRSLMRLGVSRICTIRPQIQIFIFLIVDTSRETSFY